MTSITGQRPAPRRRAAIGNVLGVGSMVVWATGFPAAEYLLDDWGAIPMTAGRFLMAALLLWPLWILVEGRGAWAGVRWGRALFIGIVGFGGASYTILLAQAFTDPVTVAVISAATPLTATLVDWVYLRRPLQMNFVVGLAFSVAGGIVATGGAVPESLGMGAALAITSALLFSWATFMTVRDLGELTALGRTTVTMTGALALSVSVAVVAALTGLQGATGTLDLPTIGLFAIYGMGSFALSQILWIGAAGRLGVALASFHINMAPFYVMIIMLALGADWSWRQAIGALIVVTGVVLAQARPGARRGG